MNHILSMLAEIRPEFDYEESENFIEDGMLDSLTLTGIIALLTMEFEIMIPYEDIVEENFNSVTAMTKLVQKLQN